MAAQGVSLTKAVHIVFVVLLLLLAGCPAEHRLYIHNKSDQTLSSAYTTDVWEVVTIPPGRTKYIWMVFGMESCFRLTVGDSLRSYDLPREVLAETNSTRYGGRLDVHYEHGQIHFQFDDGRWVQIEEVDKCDSN